MLHALVAHRRLALAVAQEGQRQQGGWQAHRCALRGSLASRIDRPVSTIRGRFSNHTARSAKCFSLLLLRRKGHKSVEHLQEVALMNSARVVGVECQTTSPRHRNEAARQGESRPAGNELAPLCRTHGGSHKNMWMPAKFKNRKWRQLMENVGQRCRGGGGYRNVSCENVSRSRGALSLPALPVVSTRALSPAAASATTSSSATRAARLCQ